MPLVLNSKHIFEGFGLEALPILKNDDEVENWNLSSFLLAVRDFFKNLGQHENHKTDFAKNFNPICFLLSLARKKCNEHSAI